MIILFSFGAPLKSCIWVYYPQKPPKKFFEIGHKGSNPAIFPIWPLEICFFSKLTNFHFSFFILAENIIVNNIKTEHFSPNLIFFKLQPFLKFSKWRLWPFGSFPTKNWGLFLCFVTYQLHRWNNWRNRLKHISRL